MGIAFALLLTVIQRGLGGVRGLVLCRMMNDQDLGQWSMIYSFLMTLAPLAVLGLPGSFGKFVEHYYREGQLKTFLQKVSMVCCVTTLIVVASIVLLPDFYSQQILGVSGQHTLMYLMALMLLLVTVLNYLTTLVEAMRQIRLATIMRFVSGVSFTILAILMLFVIPSGSVAVSVAFLASCLLGIFPAAWFMFGWNREVDAQAGPLAGSTLWIRLAPYALWWWLSNMIHNLFEVADRYMLIHWSSESAEVAQGVVGQYHSGRIIPLLMVGVAQMLAGLLLPFVAKAWSDGNIQRAREQLNWTIKLATFGVMAANVVLLVASPFIFNVLLLGRYNEGLAVLPVTMVYCTWFSIALVSQDFLWFSEKGKLAVGALGAGLLLNIILNGLLIPQYGLWGAVMGTSIGTVATLILLFVANARQSCRPDFGCWLAVLLPLCLLLPAYHCIALFTGMTLIAVFTNAVFDPNEKRQVRDLLAEKFGWRI
jgi:O-antigen/teichoic acid export membrane protein